MSHLAARLKDLAGICALVQKPVHLFLQSNNDLACIFHAEFMKHIKVKCDSLKELQATFTIMQMICPTNTNNEVFSLLQHFSEIVIEKRDDDSGAPKCEKSTAFVSTLVMVLASSFWCLTH